MEENLEGFKNFTSCIVLWYFICGSGTLVNGLALCRLEASIYTNDARIYFQKRRRRMMMMMMMIMIMMIVLKDVLSYIICLARPWTIAHLLLILRFCAPLQCTVGIVLYKSWWRHQMETFSVLLAFCAGNSPVNYEFPTQRPVTQRFDVLFDLRLHQQLSKQWRRQWFEMPSCSFWRHCNVETGISLWKNYSNYWKYQHYHLDFFIKFDKKNLHLWNLHYRFCIIWLLVTVIYGISTYCKICNIRWTKSQNLNDSRLVLQLSLPNLLKPVIKSRFKM